MLGSWLPSVQIRLARRLRGRRCLCSLLYQQHSPGNHSDWYRLHGSSYDTLGAAVFCWFLVFRGVDLPEIYEFRNLTWSSRPVSGAAEIGPYPWRKVMQFIFEIRTKARKCVPQEDAFIGLPRVYHVNYIILRDWVAPSLAYELQVLVDSYYRRTKNIILKDSKAEG